MTEQEAIERAERRLREGTLPASGWSKLLGAILGADARRTPRGRAADAPKRPGAFRAVYADKRGQPEGHRRS